MELGLPVSIYMCLVLALQRWELVFFFFFSPFNIEDLQQFLISVAVSGLNFVFPSYQAAPYNTRLTTTALGFMPREGKT